LAQRYFTAPVKNELLNWAKIHKRQESGNSKINKKETYNNCVTFGGQNSLS